MIVFLRGATDDNGSGEATETEEEAHGSTQSSSCTENERVAFGRLLWVGPLAGVIARRPTPSFISSPWQRGPSRRTSKFRTLEDL